MIPGEHLPLQCAITYDAVFSNEFRAPHTRVVSVEIFIFPAP
jgi:hypothetical protein